MIVWNGKVFKIAFVIFWYWPTPKWKIWRGYKPGFTGKKWPTVYLGPLKVVTGPA